MQRTLNLFDDDKDRKRRIDRKRQQLHLDEGTLMDLDHYICQNVRANVLDTKISNVKATIRKRREQLKHTDPSYIKKHFPKQVKDIKREVLNGIRPNSLNLAEHRKHVKILRDVQKNTWPNRHRGKGHNDNGSSSDPHHLNK